MSLSPESPSTGLRARKRTETLRRITEAGISLFLKKGFDAATVDEIAAAAGISRRTFFHYFRSKDDILLSVVNQMGGWVADGVRRAPRDARPFDAVREALIGLCAAVPAEEMIGLDRLMRSSPSVQARKQASYIQHEETLYAALRERWPDPARAQGLRVIAMVAIGAMRLASETFGLSSAQPMEVLLRNAFTALEAELATAPD